MEKSRRVTIKKISTGIFSLSLMGTPLSLFSNFPETKNYEKMRTEATSEMGFKISLAQWSLNKSFFGKSRELSWEEFGKLLRTDPDKILQGEIDPLDFPTIAKEKYGIEAVEFVNTFYFSKAENTKYLTQLKNKCVESGVKPLLIMCDAEGDLGNLDDNARNIAVEKHYKWINVAKLLGCHSIRVNAAGQGTADEVKDAAVQGLGKLAEYGTQNKINVIVENHGGYSSDGNWLSSVLSQVNSSYCGSLPDFGNFCIESNESGCVKEYDKYKGVQQLMSFAKGVSAKTHEFDAEGNETKSDYYKLLQIVKDSGYKGFIGIEYEGETLSEHEGIIATKKLLNKVFASLK